jgi:hypothetical protein
LRTPGELDHPVEFGCALERTARQDQRNTTPTRETEAWAEHTDSIRAEAEVSPGEPKTLVRYDKALVEPRFKKISTAQTVPDCHT